MTWRDADGRVFMESSRGAVIRIVSNKPRYLRANGLWHLDVRKDEDPRHVWCDGCYELGLISGGKHLIAHCHRCDHDYIYLLHYWQEEQTPGWSRGDKNWSEVDPKGRTLEQGRRDFQNSLCEGERRQVERWMP
jgi:hypothetical protein